MDLEATELNSTEIQPKFNRNSNSQFHRKTAKPDRVRPIPQQGST
jgi:hypothetical protein